MRIRLTNKIMNDDHDDVAAAVHDGGRTKQFQCDKRSAIALTRIGNLQTCGRHEYLDSLGVKSTCSHKHPRGPAPP